MTLPSTTTLTSETRVTSSETISSGKSLLMVVFDANDWREQLEQARALGQPYSYIEFDPAGGTAWKRIYLTDPFGGYVQVSGGWTVRAGVLGNSAGGDVTLAEL